jgi:hypothetical protein
MVVAEISIAMKSLFIIRLFMGDARERFLKGGIQYRKKFSELRQNSFRRYGYGGQNNAQRTDTTRRTVGLPNVLHKGMGILRRKGTSWFRKTTNSL